MYNVLPVQCLLGNGYSGSIQQPLCLSVVVYVSDDYSISDNQLAGMGRPRPQNGIDIGRLLWIYAFYADYILVMCMG